MGITVTLSSNFLRKKVQIIQEKREAVGPVNLLLIRATSLAAPSKITHRDVHD